MKKIAIILTVLFSVVIFSGCFDKNAQDNSQTSTNEQSQDSGILSFNNLKEAFESKDSMKCTYKYTSGETSFESVMYMKDNQFKTVMDVGGQNINSLFDGNTYYSWIDGQVQGFKMDNNCFEEISNEGVETDEFDPQESFFSAEDMNSAVSVKCEKADIDMSIPNNVDFQDMCEMLKNLSNAFENMQF